MHTFSINIDDNQPFFSVIIPTFNRGSMLPNAVESVIKQTFLNWELIIIDDGSTDNTKKVVEGFVDERILYFYKNNNERSAARNTGIDLCRGKYLCFLDSDEYFLNNHLKEFYNIIVDNSFPEALMYCNTYEEKEGKLVYLNQNIISSSNNVEFVVQNMISSNRVCIHKNILDKYRYNEKIRIGEDTELWTRILREYPLLANEKYTVVLSSHEGRTVHISNEETFIGHLNMIKKIINDDRGNNISKKVRKEVLSYAYYNLAKHYQYKRKKLKVIMTTFYSIIIKPNQKIKEKLYMILNDIFIFSWIIKVNRFLLKNDK